MLKEVFIEENFTEVFMMEFMLGLITGYFFYTNFKNFLKIWKTYEPNAEKVYFGFNLK